MLLWINFVLTLELNYTYRGWLGVILGIIDVTSTKWKKFTRHMFVLITYLVWMYFYFDLFAWAVLLEFIWIYNS